ncbi:MAG: HPr kinase/phosphorylase [Leptospiraceae bacterium]|nr:HPr kinase/phosphorylase [Leptospiraceae bacterium]
MPIASISVESLIRDHPDMELKLISGSEGTYNKISNSEINRPGLSLTGFFDFFAHDRIQVFGRGEWAYLNSLTEEQSNLISEKFFDYHLNCIVFTHGHIPNDQWIKKSEENSVPILTTPIGTHKFITVISDILNRALAPRTVRHGVMIEVFGIGILLQGKSGVGKSETALELIERGHRLVADDMVEIKRYSEHYLVGSCSDFLKHHMEIRGLGIINIQDIFGVGSVRDSKLLELVIQIEESNPDTYYDRTGLEDDAEQILGINIPFLRIPIKPGRNIPILVETASMNQRLKKMGRNTARNFNDKLNNLLNQREK